MDDRHTGDCLVFEAAERRVAVERRCSVVVSWTSCAVNGASDSESSSASASNSNAAIASERTQARPSCRRRSAPRRTAPCRIAARPFGLLRLEPRELVGRRFFFLIELDRRDTSPPRVAP